jgi:hypothetical protein
MSKTCGTTAFRMPPTLPWKTKSRGSEVVENGQYKDFKNSKWRLFARLVSVTRFSREYVLRRDPRFSYN